MTQWEREEEAIERDYREGRITLKQYNEQIRELQRDMRGAAEAAAEQAYRDTLDNYGY